MPCQSHPRTRTIGARCGQCGVGLQWQIQPSPHRTGTAHHDRHVVNEQAGFAAHVEAIYGRPVTADERAQLDRTVTSAIAWHTENSSQQETPKSRTGRQRASTDPPAAQRRPERPAAQPRQPRQRHSKQPAGPPKETSKVKSYTRSDGTRVRSHTRKAQITRSKEAWIATGFSSLSAVAIVLEAGVTIVSSLAMVLIAAFSWLAVLAGAHAKANKEKLRAQRKTTRPRRTTRTRTRTQRRTTRK